jgi:hypothetical protein
MVKHILIMAGEGKNVAELQCGDHVYVAWGIPLDSKKQLKIEDLREWKNAYIIDPWEGIVKPTTNVSTQDKMQTDGGSQDIMRVSQMGSRVYVRQYEKWLKTRSQAGRDSCLAHEPALIARCYNFPLFMLTGKNEKDPITSGRLVSEMEKAGFRKVGKLKPLKDIPAKDLKFGDILLIGGQGGTKSGHTGIVWKYGKRNDVVRHFLGVTKWNKKGEVIYRSDKPTHAPKPLDHGIHIHTLDAFGQLGARSSKKEEAVPYADRQTSVWRSEWVKDWKLTKQQLTIQDKVMEVEVTKKGGGKLKITRFEPGKITLAGIDLKELNLKVEPIEVSLADYTAGKGKLSPINLAGKWTDTPATYHLKKDEIHLVLNLPDNIKMELWFNAKTTSKPTSSKMVLQHVHIPKDRQQIPDDDFWPSRKACFRARPDFGTLGSKGFSIFGEGSPLRPYRKDYLMRIQCNGQTVYTYWKCDPNGVGIPFNDAFLTQLTPGLHEAKVLVVTEEGKRFELPFPIEVGKIGGLDTAKSDHNRLMKRLKKDLLPHIKGGPLDEGRKEYMLELLVNDADRMLDTNTITPETALKELSLAMILQEKIPEKPARRGGVPRGTKPKFTKSMAVKQVKLFGRVIEVCEKVGDEKACNVAVNNLINCDKKSVGDPEARKDLPRLYRKVAGIVIQAKGDIAEARKYLQRGLTISQELGKLTPAEAKKEKAKWPKPFVDTQMKMIETP